MGKSNFPRGRYLAAVRRALDYIAMGDIYQVNLAQRFEYDLTGRDFNGQSVYSRLRNFSPADYGAYFDGGDFQIISNSPEEFLRLRDGIVCARPMKGTRPRGRTAFEDEALRRELIESDKERAELLMITDLLRNDLGKVCDYGSVRVEQMRAIEDYRYVFQATSLVQGRLNEGLDAFDLLAACFPGGSITGCPKIRAMEVIEELEPCRRGIYTGALGYIDSCGAMDFNIMIRTLLRHQNRLIVHAGGGIVADSLPETEYEETLVKTESVRACLGHLFRASGRPVLSPLS